MIDQPLKGMASQTPLTSQCSRHFETQAFNFCSAISWLSLVMEKFSSEPWFEPKPSRTEPKVQFKVLEFGWTVPQVQFGVLKIYRECELPWTRSNPFELPTNIPSSSLKHPNYVTLFGYSFPFYTKHVSPSYSQAYWFLRWSAFINIHHHFGLLLPDHALTVHFPLKTVFNLMFVSVSSILFNYNIWDLILPSKISMIHGVSVPCN